jgi:hypothetical protein
MKGRSRLLWLGIGGRSPRRGWWSLFGIGRRERQETSGSRMSGIACLNIKSKGKLTYNFGNAQMK